MTAGPRDLPQKPRKKGNSHAHIQSEQSRTLARLAKTLSWPNERIAAVLDIDRKTLEKHYAEDMSRGQDEMLLKVAARLFLTATQSSDVKAANTAGIFLAKSLLGLRDTSAVELKLKNNRKAIEDETTAFETVTTFTLKIGDERFGAD